VDDARVTAQIRTALASDASMSQQARDVSIATNQQAVVLRGSVHPAEKDRIVTLAEQYAGTRTVVDQLMIMDR
jgi:osmotically-inducible protein OsmY